MTRLGSFFTSCFPWFARRQPQRALRRCSGPILTEITPVIKDSLVTQTAVAIAPTTPVTLENRAEGPSNRASNAWRRRAGIWSLDAISNSPLSMAGGGVVTWNDVPSHSISLAISVNGNDMNMDDLTIITLLNGRSQRSREPLFALLSEKHFDADEACRYYNKFQDVFDDMSLVAFLETLALSSCSCFEDSDEPIYLDDSLKYISKAKRMLQETSGSNLPEGSMTTALARLCHVEALSYSARFSRSGDLSDIRIAISNWQDSVRLSPDGDTEHRATYLNGLGNSFWALFGHSQESADLDNAITSQREAVQLTHDAHPDRSGFLNELGVSLLARFELSGEMMDLEEAIAFQKRAAQLAG